jgi:class 3 adenylate cyclase
VPGDVLGTPVYWPREQITHYRYLNPASDVFSLAAVFYEMLTGTWVREGFQELFDKCRKLGRLPSISDYMLLISNNPPVPLRQRDPNIPEPVARVIDRALREQEIPHDIARLHTMLQTLRYPDAGAFREALIQAVQQIGASGLSSSRRHSVPQQNPPKSSDQPSLVPEPQPSAETIMYSAAQRPAKQEVALFLLDIVGSTTLLLENGDTSFGTLMGTLYRRIRKHPASSDLLLLKSTGDGFLAVFRSALAAVAVAKAYIQRPFNPPVQLRMALHWGIVNTGPNGDVMGTEVRRIFRVDNIQRADRVQAGPNVKEADFSPANRIVATVTLVEQLPEAERREFRRAGIYRLNRAEDACCELWVWQSHTG